MFIKKTIFAFLIITSGQVSAQTIKSFTVDRNSVEISSNINFNLEIDRNFQETLLCGLQINFGDGEIRQFIAGLNGNKDEKMEIAHQYKKAGIYQVSVSGKLPITDLELLAKSLAMPPLCWGGKKAITVTVLEVAQKPSAPESAVMQEPIPPKTSLPNPTPAPRPAANSIPAQAPAPAPAKIIPAPAPAPNPPVKPKAESIL